MRPMSDVENGSDSDFKKKLYAIHFAAILAGMLVIAGVYGLYWLLVEDATPAIVLFGCIMAFGCFVLLAVFRALQRLADQGSDEIEQMKLRLGELMALQACPACGKSRFTWYIEDDAVTWQCFECGYTAIEDESRYGDCSRCGGESTTTVLKDATREYSHCFSCGAEQEH